MKLQLMVVVVIVSFCREFISYYRGCFNLFRFAPPLRPLFYTPEMQIQYSSSSYYYCCIEVQRFILGCWKMSHLFNPLSTHTRRRLTDLLGFGSSVVAAAVELFAGSNNLRYSILHSSIHLLSTSACCGFFLQPLVILPLYFSNPYLTVNCATAAQPNECERTNGGGVECTTAKHPLEKERNNLTIMHLLLLFILPPEFPPSKLEELFLFSRQSSLALLSSLLHSLPRR